MLFLRFASLDRRRQRLLQLARQSEPTGARAWTAGARRTSPCDHSGSEQIIGKNVCPAVCVSVQNFYGAQKSAGKRGCAAWTCVAQEEAGRVRFSQSAGAWWPALSQQILSAPGTSAGTRATVRTTVYFSAFVVSNPVSTLKKTVRALSSCFEGDGYTKENYLELIALLDELQRR
ncbi:motility-associated protein [Paraburkholderia susongensis]|uniref:motility-associated protein n=1 Tax=Paraburkholderia susongensis TaxID=1515439 RepID=UPI00117D5974|nr:motility-associated protein [Paraburkholderia susongensis]